MSNSVPSIIESPRTPPVQEVVSFKGDNGSVEIYIPECQYLCKIRQDLSIYISTHVSTISEHHLYRYSGEVNTPSATLIERIKKLAQFERHLMTIGCLVEKVATESGLFGESPGITSTLLDESFLEVLSHQEGAVVTLYDPRSKLQVVFKAFVIMKVESLQEAPKGFSRIKVAKRVFEGVKRFFVKQKEYESMKRNVSILAQEENLFYTKNN